MLSTIFQVVPSCQVVNIQYVECCDEYEYFPYDLDFPNWDYEKQEDCGRCFERCMEMTISNDKRVDAVIIILSGTTTFTPEDCNFEARIFRSDVNVYSSPIFSLSLKFNDITADLRFKMICTLRRSHPLIIQLQHGDKLCIYRESCSMVTFHSDFAGEGQIFVIYDTEHDLDNFKSIFTDVHSINKVYFQKYWGGY